MTELPFCAWTISLMIKCSRPLTLMKNSLVLNVDVMLLLHARRTLNKHPRLKSIPVYFSCSIWTAPSDTFHSFKGACLKNRKTERFPDIDHSLHFLHVCMFSSVMPESCHQHLQSWGSREHNINLSGAQIPWDGLHFCPSDPVSWGEILRTATETQYKSGQSTESLHLPSQETLLSLGFSQTSTFKAALNLCRMRKDKAHKNRLLCVTE